MTLWLGVGELVTELDRDTLTDSDDEGISDSETETVDELV